MKYKRVETKNGRVQYWVNAGERYKMTAQDEIPAAILGQLEGNMELEIAAPVVEKPVEPSKPIRQEDQKCFIDGEPAKYKKFLELQTVYLCEEHQHGLTTGEVVYEMRKAGILE